jgi:hypothetical protein
MVLKHIPECSNLIVVSGASFQSERFRDGDLDLRNVMAVEKGFQKSVGETEYQDVLRCFLAEEMIYAKDLVLPPIPVYEAIQLARRSQIRSKRLFDDQAAPARSLRAESGCGQTLGRLREDAGRERQISASEWQ